MNLEEQQPALHIPETPDEFVASARDYFAHDFPNPDHKGCPRQAEIEKLIRLDQLPDDELRRHLFSCSECFVLYRDLLDSHRELSVVPFQQRLTEFLRRWRAFILVPAFTSLVLVAMVALYLRTTSRQNGSTAEQHSTTPGNVNISPTITPTPAPAVVQEHSVKEPVALARVDLRDYTLRRGAGGPEDSPLHVSKRPTLFAISLPEGSPAGTYSVSLLDAFGKAVRTRTAQSSDGQKLTATLNLQNLADKKYRLCVARMDEPPSCYPILITEGK